LSYQKEEFHLKNPCSDRLDKKGTLANAAAAEKRKDGQALSDALTIAKSEQRRINQRNDLALRYRRTMLILLLETKMKASVSIK